MTCSLCLRCKRESSCRQVLRGGGDVQFELSRPLNGYKFCLRENRIRMLDRELLRDPAIRPENLSDALPQKQTKEGAKSGV